MVKFKAYLLLLTAGFFGFVTALMAVSQADLGVYKKTAYDKGYTAGQDYGLELGKDWGRRTYMGIPKLPYAGGYFIMIGCFREEKVCAVRRPDWPSDMVIVFTFQRSQPWTWNKISMVRPGEEFKIEPGTN